MTFRTNIAVEAAIGLNTARTEYRAAHFTFSHTVFADKLAAGGACFRVIAAASATFHTIGVAIHADGCAFGAKIIDTESAIAHYTTILTVAAKKDVADVAIQSRTVGNGTATTVIATKLIHTVETVELALNTQAGITNVITTPPALMNIILNHTLAADIAPCAIIVVAGKALHITLVAPAVVANILVTNLTIVTFASFHIRPTI